MKTLSSEREAAKSFKERTAYQECRRLRDDLGMRPFEAGRIARMFQAGLEALQDTTQGAVNLSKVHALRWCPRTR